MSHSQPELLDDYSDGPPQGYISAQCRFSDDGQQRLVFVGNKLAYTYDRDDRLATRQVWCMVYESNLATYKQISDTVGISRRALQYWVERYREEGTGGLSDRARSGAPRKVTPAARKKIYRLRDKRLNIREIARCCQLSEKSIRLALAERRSVAEAKQQQLAVPAQPEREDDPGTDQPCSAPEEHDETAGDTSKSVAPKTGSEAATGDLATEASDEVVTTAPSIAENVSITAPAGGWNDRQEAAMAVDRTTDRALAVAGLIDDAEPLFAPCEHLELAGAFLAVAAAATDPFLRLGKQAYGSFGGAFYGVRTMLLTLVVMMLLRIARPEWLRKRNPVKLGRVLGLDRVPEVKTIRRRLHHFEGFGKATQLMRDLAAARRHDYDGPINVVHVDGHQLVYTGEENIGEIFSSRCKKVVKAETDNWVNFPGSFPLMVITCEFNQALSQVLLEVMKSTRQVLGLERLCCCFDRGGYNVLLFEQLIAAGFDIITYRKGDYAPVAEDAFPFDPVTINSRTYPRGPYDGSVELKIYEPIGSEGSKPARRDTKRTLKLREIRILRKDRGQTAILTSCPAAKIAAVDVAALLFDRIGSQENTFKYLRREFLLDALPCYGGEPLKDKRDHPNPAYTRLEKQIAKLRCKRNALLGKYADMLIGVDADAAVQYLQELRRNKQGQQSKLPANKRRSLAKDADALANITHQLQKLATKRDQTSPREDLTESGFKRLKSELRQFMNVVKISAYHIETDLVKLISEEYRNSEDEARSVIAAAFHSSGSLRLEPGRLVICLEPQAEPRRTRAINHVAEALSARQIRFPGSQRVIVFEPTPAPHRRCRSSPEKAQRKNGAMSGVQESQNQLQPVRG